MCFFFFFFWKHVTDVSNLDIHLRNTLIRLPSKFDELSVDQLYGRYGKPRTEAIIRLDERPLSPSVPSHATMPVWLGKKSR